MNHIVLAVRTLAAIHGCCWTPVVSLAAVALPPDPATVSQLLMLPRLVLHTVQMCRSLGGSSVNFMLARLAFLTI